MCIKVKQKMCSLSLSQRGFVTGVVLSALAISAFFFSSISNIFFADDTSAFLLFLSLGTSLPMILGFFLVRPIPLPDDTCGNYEARSSSRTRLLDPNFVEGQNLHHSYSVPNSDATEDASEHSENINSQASKLSSTITDFALLRNLEDRKIFWSGDFWLLATISSLRACSKF